MEHIGKVTMNMIITVVSLYSDGDIEDTLLEIVKNHDRVNFQKYSREKVMASFIPSFQM